VIRGASAVIAGNEYLARYAREANSNVTLIPTVVDVARYLPCTRKRGHDGRLVVGWIGSPSSAGYLLERIEALRRFCRNASARLVLVGSGPIELPGVPVEVRSWREDAEVAEIQRFDIGIMPIPDTPWARGKCGFKLIQYMACGVPVVASPVGANVRIVDDGQNGFLAGTDDQWVAALSTLAASSLRRQQFGMAGREKVVRRYSLDVAAPLLAGVLAERTPTAHQ
jgi:glycosyltransferase involved in cell wall biosynthesis